MSASIVEINDDVSWDEQQQYYADSADENPSHLWFFKDESGVDVRAVVVFVVGTLCFLLVCCTYLRPRWFGRSARMNGYLWSSGEPDAQDEIINAELRAKVIEAIFSQQKANDATDFQYDEESHSLQWTEKCNDTMNPTTCSICLDKFHEGDFIISSQCSHIFHRDCVMGWVEKKDDCPMCRQPMWDDEKYKVLENEMMEVDDAPDDEHMKVDDGGGAKKRTILDIMLNR